MRFVAALVTSLVLSSLTETVHAQGAAVTDFVLVDTSTGRDIMLMDDGMAIDIQQVGDQLSIRVQATSSTRKVDIDINGLIMRTEITPPYYIAGSYEDEIYTSNSIAELGPHYVTACASATADFSVGRLDAASDACKTIRFTTQEGTNLGPPPTETGSDVDPIEADFNGVIQGNLMVNDVVTLGLSGPPASETSTTNPGIYRPPSVNADYKLDCTFTHGESGTSFVIPGFYAGDGNAANLGSVGGDTWVCLFVPSQPGSYSYSVNFREGTNVALFDGGNPGNFFDGATGNFEIAAQAVNATGFYGKGKLGASTTKNRLVFANGEYFTPVGPSSPSNLLAYDDFDDTPNNNMYRKSYAVHEQDFKTGDVTFRGANGTSIIGAINYLASKGINSITATVLTQDGNVYPFVEPERFLAYDISKLDQWRVVFDHTAKKGMMLRLALQDSGSDSVLNGGNLLEERKLFMREMVARFGHHLGLVWDLGEDLTATQIQERCTFLRSIDAYKSPIAIRTTSAIPDPEVLGISCIDIISVSTATADVNTVVMDYVEAANSINNSTRPTKLVISTYEQGDGVGTTTDDATNNVFRQDVLWGALMAGGADVSYYFGTKYVENDLTTQSFRSRAKLWEQSTYALNFLKNFPVQDMIGNNNLVTNGNWCFHNEKHSVVVVYKKSGIAAGSIDLLAPPGSLYNVRWYNPRTGGALQKVSSTSVVGAGEDVPLGLAPNGENGDWLILLTCTNCA
jgi:hypothetical protein